jgi:hypothetical protein
MSPVCDVGVRWVAGLVVPHGVMGEWSLPLSARDGPCAMLCAALSMCCALDFIFLVGGRLAPPVCRLPIVCFAGCLGELRVCTGSWDCEGVIVGIPSPSSRNCCSPGLLVYRSVHVPGSMLL